MDGCQCLALRFLKDSLCTLASYWPQFATSSASPEFLPFTAFPWCDSWQLLRIRKGIRAVFF